MVDKRELMNKHTVIPFYTRLYTKTERSQFNSNFLTSTVQKMPYISSLDPFSRIGCKYCPICCIQDKRTYGEPYWHREHQIPLLTICLRHRCRLHVAEGSISWWSQKLLPLSDIPIVSNANFDINQWEEEVAMCIMDYLTLPESVCRMEKSISLFDCIIPNNYEILRSKDIRKVQGEYLGNALRGKYGDDVFKVYFNRDIPRMLLMLRKWYYKVPDKYILIQCLLNRSTEDMLSGNATPKHSVFEK